MAALDFGMALARGMLPTSEKAQKDLINLAGGRNIFKSEDWWSKQVDKQIKEGYREVAHTSKEFLTASGDYLPGKRNVSTSYVQSSPFGLITYSGGSGPLAQSAPSYNPIFGYSGGWQQRTSVSYDAPEGAIFTVDPRTRQKQYISRDIDVFGSSGFPGSSRKDYTASELKDIEKSAKAGAKKLKSQTEASKSAQKKLRRGTGGLMGKARLPGELPSTGLPELGSVGLGLEQGTLGGKVKL